MDEDNNEMNLDNFFNESVQNPFTYNLKLKDKVFEDFNILFEEVKRIFIHGLFNITNNNNIRKDDNDNNRTVMIDKVPKKDIELVKKYMLSLGIEVVHKEYTDEDKDYHIRSLLYDLQNKLKDDVKIDITMDWIKQLIFKTHIRLINGEKIDELNKIIRCYPETNFFLKLYKPEKVEDCYISYINNENKNVLNVIYFKSAELRDYHYYHKYTTPQNKHVR